MYWFVHMFTSTIARDFNFFDNSWWYNINISFQYQRQLLVLPKDFKLKISIICQRLLVDKKLRRWYSRSVLSIVFSFLSYFSNRGGHKKGKSLIRHRTGTNIINLSNQMARFNYRHTRHTITLSVSYIFQLE